MSLNLANRPNDHRQLVEDEKARLFEFWQQNLERAKVEAGKLIGEKGKRKGQWSAWVAGELDKVSPPEFQAMIKRELARL